MPPSLGKNVNSEFIVSTLQARGDRWPAVSKLQRMHCATIAGVIANETRARRGETRAKPTNVTLALRPEDTPYHRSQEEVL